MRHKTWLLQELQRWQQHGIIDQKQGDQIVRLYDNPASSAWGKVVFAALGAVLIGLGVILLFAYNWEDMHRLSKLALIFIALLTAYGAGWYWSRAQSRHPKIGESLFLLGSMLFGAGIWLVAQIYHIEDHYPNAFLIWALGALAMAWVLNSKPQLLLALAIISVWHYTEVFNFQHSNNLGILIVLVGALPLAWRLQSPSTLFSSVLLFLFTYTASYSELAGKHGETTLVVFLCLSAGTIAGSFLARATRYQDYFSVLRMLGVCGFSIALFIATFEAIDDLAFDAPLAELPVGLLLYYWLAAAIAFTTCGWQIAGWLTNYTASAINSEASRKTFGNLIDFGETLVVTLTTLVASVLAFFPAAAGVGWLLYNFLFLGLCMLLIYRGTQYQRWQSAALGSALLSAFAFARFMDLFDSLLLRGLAFVIIGLLLFGVGLFYSHQKNKHGAGDQP